MKIRRIFLSAAALLLSGVMIAQNYGWHPDDENYAESCTSIMVGKKASTDGSVMTAHSCDSNYRTWLTMEESKTYADGKQPVYWGMLHTEEHDDLRNLEVKGYIPAPTTPTYRCGLSLYERETACNWRDHYQRKKTAKENRRSVYD